MAGKSRWLSLLRGVPGVFGRSVNLTGLAGTVESGVFPKLLVRDSVDNADLYFLWVDASKLLGVPALARREMSVEDDDASVLLLGVNDPGLGLGVLEDDMVAA